MLDLKTQILFDAIDLARDGFQLKAEVDEAHLGLNHPEDWPFSVEKKQMLQDFLSAEAELRLQGTPWMCSVRRIYVRRMTNLRQKTGEDAILRHEMFMVWTHAFCTTMNLIENPNPNEG